MSAWGVERGGPLDLDAVDRLVLLLRSWQEGAGVDLSEVTVEGEIARGKAQYGARCAGCHGATGGGGLFMSINNPEFLAVASDGYIREAIASGRSGTAMTAYTGVLTEQAIDDLVVLIRSWQTPVNNASVVLPSGDLGSANIHPGGPDPVFGEGPYVPADEVKAQLDAGADMVLLDARPPVDYTTGHITGAVSVPFYAVAEVADQLPTDVTIVAYCGCPHAESTLAAQALIDEGYEVVKVLDEGYYVWTERGYPVTHGSLAGTWEVPVEDPDVTDAAEVQGDVVADTADGDGPEVGPTSDAPVPSDTSTPIDAPLASDGQDAAAANSGEG
jgi:rhodanese-related sulfurtransferase/mono/diheme cytochrome c family protein